MADMEAGREMDALVAERAMGWTKPEGPAPTMSESFALSYWRNVEGRMGAPPSAGWAEGLLVRVPAYSTDIGAAWEVVEAMAARGWAFDLRVDHEPWHDGAIAQAEFFGCNAGLMDGRRVTGRADTAPLAICRAALRTTSPATGAEGGEDGDE